MTITTESKRPTHSNKIMCDLDRILTGPPATDFSATARFFGNHAAQQRLYRDHETKIECSPARYRRLTAYERTRLLIADASNAHNPPERS
jgi:hypothetical protein